ncbi:UvrD-helicase domain-containing protein [bacterium]|nr:UvrD-helicase domain-containing protein [bacterium]
MNNLNPEQSVAVKHIKGPLLIIAGAGTGKTHVLTSRIIHLLKEKVANASDILALTFTEKATDEMIERIDKALPYSYEDMAIHTFHAFCDKILREEGLEIGLDTSYIILPEIDQWMLIKKHLFEFDLNYYRPLGNTNKFISALGKHFSRLKDEDISPEKYYEYAENQEDGVEKDRLLELASAYKKYQELIVRENSMDFNDLQYYVLRLFEKRPAILKQYQEKFKYILVDEFQDTNFIQTKIINLLAQAHKNITVVGDDDQSIYRWRGASMNNVNEFNKQFPNTTKIILKENYRSTPEILDVSYEVIKNNNPYRIDKKLHSQLKNGKPVEILSFDHYQQETEYIASKIEELSKNKDFNEFAILVRSHALAKPFIEEFKTRKIPFQVRNKQALATLPEIKDMIAVLKFLANPTDDLALFRILRMPIYSFKMEEVLLMVNEAKSAYKSIYSLIKEKNTFKKIVETLNKLIDFTKSDSISRILGEFLKQSKYIQYLQNNQSVENEEKIVSIASFLQLIKEYEQSHSHHDVSIITFLDYLSLLDQAGATLDNSLTNNVQDAVQILSVHAAKGLEFPVVFIPSLVKNRFPGTNKKDQIRIPDALSSEEIPEGDIHLQEERRLFYVACTRAKEQLFLTYSQKYQGTKKWKPSPFIEEARKSNSAIVTNCEPTKIQEYSEKETPVRKINIYSPKTLSYSKLNTFSKCPLKYKFGYIYKIPTPSAHASNFGTSIHNTLKDIYQYITVHKDISLDKCKEFYEKNWISKGYDNKAHHNTRKKKGWEIIQKYYEENSNPWVIPTFIEKGFFLKLGKHTLSGRIDRIDMLKDGTYEIIDYKTGKLKKESEVKKDLQLSLYALACKEIYKIPVSKLSLYFLEDNKKISTTRDSEQLKKAREKIIKQSNELIHSSFEATPGFNCQFCEYRLLCNKAE